MDDETMVSFDESLFTNIPVDESLEVILRRLHKDKTLTERANLSPTQITHLLELCLRTTYFKFQRTYYQQRDGAAMGFPVSQYWQTYIHGNVWGNSQEQLNIHHKFGNTIWTTHSVSCRRLKLKVSWAFQQHSPHHHVHHGAGGRQSTILDSLLHREDDGILEVSVYWKSTHTDRYLHFSPTTLPMWREAWSPASSTKLGPLPRTWM